MSELLIEGLHLDLQPKARLHRERAFKPGIDVLFTAGRRTFAEQMAAFEHGRQRTPQGWVVVDPAHVVTHTLPEQAPRIRR